MIKLLCIHVCVCGLPWWPNGEESTWDARAAGDAVPPQGREDPLEEDTATHSSVLAWRIPWTEGVAGSVRRVKKSQT